MEFQRLAKLEIKKAIRRAKRMGIGRPGIDLSPREQMCLDRVHEDLEARRALEFLSEKCGLTEKMLIAKIVLLAWTPIVLAEDTYSREGSDRPKALLEFAAELCAAAKRVGKLNDDKFWHMKMPVPHVFPERLQQKRRLPGKRRVWAVRVPPEVFREGVSQFEGLPRLLEAYATNIRHKAWFNLAMDRQKPRRKKLQQKLEEGLMEEIRGRSGGKYRFREKVSAILRVVYSIAGVRPARGESLRKREYRKRRLASRITTQPT
jgi:hypothetical protein